MNFYRMTLSFGVVVLRVLALTTKINRCLKLGSIVAMGILIDDLCALLKSNIV